MSNDKGGYPLGDRTSKPHHPDGWGAERESKEESKEERGEANPRGTKPRSGSHDRSEKD